jgi:hypothetical protein
LLNISGLSICIPAEIRISAGILCQFFIEYKNKIYSGAESLYRILKIPSLYS